MFQVHGILKDLIHKSMSETMASTILIVLSFVCIVLYMFMLSEVGIFFLVS